MIIRGLNMSGIKINTIDNFASIPGLLHWFDARRNVITTSGLVTSWSSIAGEGITALNATINSQQGRFPLRENNYSLKFEAVGTTSRAILNNNAEELTRYANGWRKPTRFGIYRITKVVLNPDPVAATQSSLYGIIMTGDSRRGSNSIVNRSGFWTSNILQRENGVNVLSSVLNSSVSGNNIITTTFNLINNTLLQDGVDVGSGYQLIRNQAYNNTVISPDQTCIQYISMQRNAEVSYLYADIVYDWTGFTDEEVTAFDLRVKDLLTPLRQEFVNLETP